MSELDLSSKLKLLFENAEEFGFKKHESGLMYSETSVPGWYVIMSAEKQMLRLVSALTLELAISTVLNRMKESDAWDIGIRKDDKDV